MSISNSDYSKMTDKASPNSPVVKNCLFAFLFGGGICCFGEALNSLWRTLVGFGKERAVEIAFHNLRFTQEFLFEQIMRFQFRL